MFLKEMLRKQGYSVFPFTRGVDALEWATENPPDLVLLDIIMPGMDGFELFQHLKHDDSLCDIPVIFISSQDEIETKVKAFTLGCVDYITRPFEAEEVKTRVNTHLRLRQMQVELENQNLRLSRMVETKVKEITESWIATVFALAKLAESRDDETGDHLERVRELCRLIAERLAVMPGYHSVIDQEFVENIYHASPLHDIGKVGIPDYILLKPGKLTPEEFDIMKQHTVIGAHTLKAVQDTYQGNIFIEMGIDIARSHHEWWDGTGYPDGISGQDIPLSACIMAVADVYDALRTNRCYKTAIPHEKAVAVIRQGKGTHFSPDVADVFLKLERYLQELIKYPEVRPACI
jgi:putative two-component system response regulator